MLRVETLYRPVADPSLPERELERQVPSTHPAAVKVQGILEAMLKRFGGPPPPAAEPPAPAEQPAPVDRAQWRNRPSEEPEEEVSP